MMKKFQTQSQQAQVQLLVVLAVGAVGVAAASLLRWDLVRAVYLSDIRNILLNGAIATVFATGVWKLFQAFGSYDFDEKQLAEFTECMARGTDIQGAMAELEPRSIIAGRIEEIQELFDRHVPIHHGALSSIMVAEQSVWSSYPRFVNNILILTGVFGTIVSMIFALVGATRTLGSAVPTEGMAIMLSGMNTALTTTATAIVCFFIYSYFYGRLTDIQTCLLSKIEKAVLIHVIPRFAFDTDTINHQTAQLIRQLQALITEIQKGAGFISQALTDLNSHNTRALEKLDGLLGQHDSHLDATGKVISRLKALQDILIEGFRLKP